MRATIVVLIALTACSQPAAIGIHRSTVVTDRALAFSEIVRSHHADRAPGMLVIIDREALRRTLMLDDAAVVEMLRQLPEGTVVGSTEMSERCAIKEEDTSARCLGIRVKEFRERDGVLEMDVLWFPIGGCGSYNAALVVRVRGGQANIVEVTSEDFGDCAGRRQ